MHHKYSNQRLLNRTKAFIEAFIATMVAQETSQQRLRESWKREPSLACLQNVEQRGYDHQKILMNRNSDSYFNYKLMRE